MVPTRTQRRSSTPLVRTITPTRSPSRTSAATGTTSPPVVPVGRATVAALPARRVPVRLGTTAFTVNRLPALAGTTPSTVAVTAWPSMVAVRRVPRVRPRTASVGADTLIRRLEASCTVTSGMPGAAKVPGSACRMVTMPLNGARTVA